MGALDLLNMSRVFVVGYRLTSMHSTYPTLLKIDGGNTNAPNEVTMIYNPGHTVQNSPDKTKLAGFSPLQSPYGEYNASRQHKF
jgi:hypothetical protein